MMWRMDTIGTNNILTRQINRIQGGRSESGTKVAVQIRMFPACREIPISVFFFLGHGSFQIHDLKKSNSKESFLRRYKDTKERSWSNSYPHLFQILCESFSGDCGTREGEGERGGTENKNVSTLTILF